MRKAAISWRHRFKKIAHQHWPLAAAILTLGLLLFKNPFSERNLIANFDPFPDAFHYVTPPRCFLQGKGWRLCRPDMEGIKPDVPILYSILLLPAFAIHNDPRVFFFVNVLLSFTSLWLMYLLVRSLTTNTIIIGFVLFLYVTNYFIYWYPTLAMAENLILPLVLGGLYVLVRNIEAYHLKWAVAASLIAIAIYLTKPAFGPFVPIFLSWTIITLFIHRQHFSIKVRRFALAGGILLLLLLLVVNARSIWWVTSSVFDTTPLTDRSMHDKWFAPEFWWQHFPEYTSALFGKSIPFLWDRTPMVTWWTGVGGILGLLTLLIQKKKNRWLIGLVLFSTLWSQIVFIASFYAIDGRYIYHAIPILLLGLAALLEYIYQRTSTFPKYVIFLGLLTILGGQYFFSHAMILKKQIMINLKYAEQPWWYLSVKKIDSVMFALPHTDKTRYLIVAHPPFLFDFYTTGNYHLLPLTPLQDFRENKRAKIWGDFDYSDYVILYKTLLEQGNELYLTNYGLGNDRGYHADFKNVENSLSTTMIESGCYNLCNVYKVELQNDLK